MRVIAVLVDKVDRGEDQVPVWVGTTQGAGNLVGTTQHADSPDKVKAALGLFVLELVLCYLCVLMLWMSELWTLGPTLETLYEPGLGPWGKYYSTIFLSCKAFRLGLSLSIGLPGSPTSTLTYLVIFWSPETSEWTHQLTDGQMYVDHRYTTERQKDRETDRHLLSVLCLWTAWPEQPPTPKLISIMEKAQTKSEMSVVQA